MTGWLSIIGMGEDGRSGLSPRALSLLCDAEVVVGSRRLLALAGETAAERHEWPQPFSAVVDRIRPLRGRRTVVLATGDPLHFGVARKLMEIVPFEEMEIVPHLSSFSLAAARMGWPLGDCDTITLHGRPAAGIEGFIQPGARILALTADGSTVAEVARRLVARGYGASDMTVLENMGGPREDCFRFRAEDIPERSFSDLNTLAVRCRPGPGAALLPRVPGLPDEAFVHDGQLTKREVRAATLAALAPYPDALLWDVGAGCGSIAIEWMRAARGARAIAFERDAQRLRMIGENAERLGAPRLKVVAGAAPASLSGQEAPDAVFIGGGMGIHGVFEDSWAALKPQGRMVANVVSLEGELHLVDLQEKHGGDLVRLDVSCLTRIGSLRALRPRLAVLQWRAVKP
ncbi:MAG: precorrin-6y C5,15-methyltransferase (decarboxylating) subunit CbiE [Parvibaculaceae bacterium]